MARPAPHVKHASFPLGVGAFRPKFQGKRVIPGQNVDTIRKIVDCTTTLLLEVFRQWNFVALSMVFWLIFLQKKQIWVSESHSGEARGDAQFG